MRTPNTPRARTMITSWSVGPHTFLRGPVKTCSFIMYAAAHLTSRMHQCIMLLPSYMRDSYASRWYRQLHAIRARKYPSGNVIFKRSAQVATFFETCTEHDNCQRIATAQRTRTPPWRSWAFKSAAFCASRLKVLLFGGGKTTYVAAVPGNNTGKQARPHRNRAPAANKSSCNLAVTWCPCWSLQQAGQELLSRRSKAATSILQKGRSKPTAAKQEASAGVHGTDAQHAPVP
jgi:hypothetical protein